MSSPLLLPQTITRIKNQAPNLIGEENNGSRKVSLGLVSASVSRSSSSSLPDDRAFIDIPVRFESAFTFEFLCFTTAKAQEIFNALCVKQHATKTTLNIDEYAKEFATAYCDNAQDTTDDWITTMREAGIKEEIQLALMKPEHDRIRKINTLSTWMEIIIDTNYFALIEMNAKILYELGEPAEPPELSLRGGGEEEYTVPQMPGGHLAIYKSVDFRRTIGCVSEDGTVDLQYLESTGPTDFARRGGLYFTHQLWVARHYSALISDACPASDRRTVEMHVPLAHFAKVKTWDLKPDDDDLKQLWFYSRRSAKYPKELSKKRAAVGVIQGPIAHTHNKSFGKMESWQDVTDNHILKEDDEEEGGPAKIATQYAWIKEGAIEELEIDCAGKLYLRRPEDGFRKIAQPWKDTSSKSEAGLM